MIKLKILEGHFFNTLKSQNESVNRLKVRAKILGASISDNKDWNPLNTAEKATLSDFHTIFSKELEPHFIENKEMAFLEISIEEVCSYEFQLSAFSHSHLQIKGYTMLNRISFFRKVLWAKCYRWPLTH